MPFVARLRLATLAFVVGVGALAGPGCQRGDADAGAPAARVAPAAGTPLAYEHDIERICNVMELSGASANPGGAGMLTARWLAANIETSAGKQFMISLNQLAPAAKADALDAAAGKAGLGGCPLALQWRGTK